MEINRNNYHNLFNNKIQIYFKKKIKFHMENFKKICFNMIT